MAKKDDNLEPIPLSSFVEDTLNQIIQGVKNSQNNSENSGAVIYPDRLGPKNDYYQIGNYGEGFKYYSIQDVEFKVAIIYEYDEKLDKIQIKVPILDVSVAGKEGVNTRTTNQIEFSIPLVIPNP